MPLFQQIDLNYLLTASFKAFAGLKTTAFAAGISIFLPVAGFVPVRAALSFLTKFPKPESLTSSP